MNTSPNFLSYANQHHHSCKSERDGSYKRREGFFLLLFKERKEERKPASLEEGEDGDGDEVAVDAEGHLAHADVEHGLGQHVVAAVGRLHQRHPEVHPQRLIPPHHHHSCRPHTRASAPPPRKIKMWG